MQIVKILEKDDQVIVKSPYHSELPYEAKRLGGKWIDSAWVYDRRDLDRVKELYLDIFGTDGTSCELVDVKITISENEFLRSEKAGIYAYGREVARAYGRDSGAKIGPGVIMINGSFKSGGSVKNWSTESTHGVIFELRDIPKRMLEKELILDGFHCEIRPTVEIVREEIDIEALTIEKEQLIKRLAEINLKLREVK